MDRVETPSRDLLVMAHILATLGLIGVALLLGATWYEAVVMAPNYERDVPASMVAARAFLVRTTPAHYFRFIAPFAQITTLLALLFDWRRPGRRALLVAFVILVVGDIITFACHYPRLAIMFKNREMAEPDVLRRAAREWAIGNWVRGALLVAAFLALLHALLRIPVAGS